MTSEKYIPAPPITPGTVLRKYILKEKITQDELADAMKVSRFSVNQIVNGRRSVTAEMALRLAFVTSTTPDFWLNLQRDVDLYSAKQKIERIIRGLTVLRSPKAEHEMFKMLDD